MSQIQLKLQPRTASEVEVNEVNAAVDDVRWRRLLEAFRAAAAAVDRKELLFRLDVKPSQFSDALGDRDKHVHLRWLVAVADLAPREDRLALAAELADLCGCDVVERVELTAEEELAALKAAVRSELGAVGDRLLASVRTRGAR